MSQIALSDFELVQKEPPHHKSLWGKIYVDIRNNKTGEIRRYHTDTLLGDEQEPWSDFWWSEGNAGCDCNRALFFGYAIGQEYEEIDSHCGDGGYSVNIYSTKNGKELYSEFINPTKESKEGV